MFPNLYLPFNHYPYYRRYNRNIYNSIKNLPKEDITISNTNNINNNMDSRNTLNIDDKNINNKNNLENRNQTESFLFDLFGLKLYFDDILLICLIFFLYTEGVKDESLFITLILLLLT